MTTTSVSSGSLPHDRSQTAIASAFRDILTALGEAPDREGLLMTPTRYAKALLFFTKGYSENIDDVVHGALFQEPSQEPSQELIIVRDITISSMCEHHMIPFIGKVR
jgi:GTP cyclohydrolase I